MKHERFHVSRSEIDRRTRAFISLALALPATIVCGSALLPGDERALTLVLAACIFAAMFIIGVLTITYLRTSHLSTVFELEGETLRRIVASRVKETIDLAKIKQLHTKYTSYGPIRQITLTEYNGHHHNLDGAEQFEQLRGLLIKACPTARISTSREPINYDHDLFYPALGFALGGLSVLAVVLLRILGDWANRVAQISVVMLVLALAVYIVGAKPLARQYGPTTKMSDWFLALLLATMAMALGVTGFFIFDA